MASEGSFVQPAIPRFDGHYDHWSMLMENFLRSKEYWNLVEIGFVEPADGAAVTEAQQKSLDEMKLKDRKVKNYLFQAIDRTILETILKKDTSKQIWDSMKKKFEGNAQVKRSILQALRRDFETLEMKPGEIVIDYFSRVMSVANKMRNYGEDMQDVKVVEKILRSLTEKFNYIVCSIEESKNIDQLSIDELESSLIVHEQKFHRNNGEEQALKITHENSSGARGRGRGGFRGRERGRGRQQFDKSTVECYNCHKLGHFQWECPSNEIGANFAKTQEEMLLMACVDVNKDNKEDMWYLDSGCSNHMCGKKEYFSDLNENFRDSVKLGNNSSMTVIGKGNIRLQVNGTTQIITEVFYVPELKSNLLSIGQLQEKGLTVLFQHGRCKVFHHEKGLIMDTKMSANRMFILQAISKPITSVCFNTITEDLVQLWHCRYGHLSFTGLKTLQQKAMVNGLPQLKTPSRLCKDCLVGKQHRDSFPKRSSWRAFQILQLLHADICGPIKPISNSKKRYLLTFIDDFSRKTWVFFLTENPKPLMFSKDLRSEWKKRQTLHFKHCELIEEESLHHKNSIIFVMQMVYRDS